MPAVSIAIVRNGHIAWRRAFGVKNTGTNEPVDTDTMFASCSNTKPVFAYGVLKLCEKGVLALDTPLTQYTKRRVTQDPRITLITTRHILSHTAGFPNWRQGRDLPIAFEPGSKYEYSGEGFAYLQSVVEEVTRKPFVDFMQDDVLKPLGMTSSRVASTGGTEYAKRVANGHDQNGKPFPHKPPLLFTHAGSASGWYCFCGASTERRSGLMVMLNGDNYVPFLLKMLADPSGPPVPPEKLWSNFAQRCFAP